MTEILLIVLAAIGIGLAVLAAWVTTHPKPVDDTHEVANLFMRPPDPVYWCVAGTMAQSEQERTRFGIDRKHWRYISSPDVLRGENIDPDLVIFTGTWDQRHDLEAISDGLLIASRLNTGWERP